MENWVIVALVLGSNAIIFLGNWLLMKKQLKHFDGQLEKRLEGQREADKHEREREVGSEPLLKLRNELARMAAKGEKVGSVVFGSGGGERKEHREEFIKALGDWNDYMARAEFEDVLFMQHDFKLVSKVNDIRLDYVIARLKFQVYQLSDEADKKKEYDEGMEIIRGNRVKVAEVQSEISKLLKEL